MVQTGKTHRDLKLEHVCLAWGQGWVLLFQEDEGDLFESIRNRIKSGQGRICSSGADFLAYNLIDTMVDHYFIILEKKIEAIEKVEEKLLLQKGNTSRTEIYALRRDMLLTRRQIWPVREVVNQLVRTENPLVQEQTRFYLRDVYDHCVEIIDSIEGMRETLASLAEVQLSMLTHKMNSVMMVLTVIATIFMPLTFISSIYGMNFKHMPELDWEYGYPAALLFMFTVAMGMLIWFRRKKWI
jgi:magnesium transporter